MEWLQPISGSRLNPLPSPRCSQPVHLLGTPFLRSSHGCLLPSCSSNVTSPEPPRLSRCPTLILFLTPPRPPSAAQLQLYLFYPSVICLPQLNGGLRMVGTLPCSLLHRRAWQKTDGKKHSLATLGIEIQTTVHFLTCPMALATPLTA